MNKERIFDVIIEAYESAEAYHGNSAKYYKKHGFHAYFDIRRKMDDDTARLYYDYQRDNTDGEKVRVLFEVFKLDRDQVERAYTATRFLRKWYNRTAWQFCPSDDLVNRLWAFVIG